MRQPKTFSLVFVSVFLPCYIANYCNGFLLLIIQEQLQVSPGTCNAAEAIAIDVKEEELTNAEETLQVSRPLNLMVTGGPIPMLDRSQCFCPNFPESVAMRGSGAGGLVVELVWAIGWGEGTIGGRTPLAHAFSSIKELAPIYIPTRNQVLTHSSTAQPAQNINRGPFFFWVTKSCGQTHSPRM